MHIEKKKFSNVVSLLLLNIFEKDRYRYQELIPRI